MVLVDDPSSSASAASGLLNVIPSVRAKSLPDPMGMIPRRGRRSFSMAMSPLTTSWMTPSPPSAMTVSLSDAWEAILTASRGSFVRTSSNDSVAFS